jgi:hypothetical protein
MAASFFIKSIHFLKKVVADVPVRVYNPLDLKIFYSANN